jgi:hypothetical protein
MDNSTLVGGLSIKAAAVNGNYFEGSTKLYLRSFRVMRHYVLLKGGITKRTRWEYQIIAIN